MMHSVTLVLPHPRRFGPRFTGEKRAGGLSVLPPLESFCDPASPPPRSIDDRSSCSVEERLDDRGERVPRPVEPRLHRSKVARGDLGDLLVRLSFKLAKHEHLAVVLWQLRDRLLHQLS